jgi:hypothetical protein
MKKVFLVSLAVVGLIGSLNATPIVTTASNDANALAQALIGSGITVSNATLVGGYQSSGTYVGGNEAQGNAFLSNGIVLSSGYVTNLNTNGLNTSTGITGDLGINGSPILDKLIPGFTTYDATILSFDFVAEGDPGSTVTSSFQYVFGSDEYNEYVNTQFNDVFGFFLDGTNLNNNIALIPGTSTPVSINNVNLGANSSYYTNNETGNPIGSEMDGMTIPLYTQFQVSANQTHHLDLAIADAGDHILDSWVLIGGESFVPHSVPEPGTISLLGFGLLSLLGCGLFRRKKN